MKPKGSLSCSQENTTGTIIPDCV